MSCSVYLIKSKIDDSFYVGISENPKKRLLEHNSGKLKITSKRKPYELIYSKEYMDYKSARKHEIWLKKKSTMYKNKLAQLAPPELGGVK
ncbi:GIY-YIG nuclease family protein [Candidatus Nomurabacteria bacterium]|nr:GIY-YIG nuclease family protein [Candidatus Nomurabacteria bacterium]